MNSTLSFNLTNFWKSSIIIQGVSDANSWRHIYLFLKNPNLQSKNGGQLFAYGDDIGVGHLNQNTVYHDNTGGGMTDVDWFGGIIDEVLVYGSAFDEADFAELAAPLSVEAQDKFTTTWANIKAQRTLR